MVLKDLSVGDVSRKSGEMSESLALVCTASLIMDIPFSLEPLSMPRSVGGLEFITELQHI